MKNVIFVTGFHRGGTHAQANQLSGTHGLLNIEETVITWDNWNEINDLCGGFLPQLVDGKKVSKRDVRLDKGFVLQCPMVAHRAVELSKIGRVYWCDRSSLALVTSMKNQSFTQMAWDIMTNFKNQFAQDSIWSTLDYDGAEDTFHDFVGYYSLLVKVKKYLFNKYLSSACTLVPLEKQAYYNESSAASMKTPLLPGRLQAAMKELNKPL